MAGELLKRRREELGLDLKQTADLLKIKESYLASIEEDCFEKLPVAVYTLGYIRCYATHLNVDPEPIIAFYSGHLIQPKASTIFPVASSKKKMPLYYSLIPALVLLLILAVVVLRQESPVPEIKIAAVPAQPVQEFKPVQTDRVQLLPAGKPEPPQIQPVPPLAGSRSSGVSPSQAAGEHSLEIIADDLTWVHIRFSDGKYEEILLNPGMTRKWQFADKAVLKLGNAGGIRLNLDGRNIGSPGSRGQVITLVFPENQQIKRQDE